MAPTSTSTQRRVSDAEAATASSTQTRKRKSTNDGAAGDSSEEGHRSAKRFQHLKPRTKRISQHQITSKWTSLAPPAQQQVQELFKAAKRPVILSRQDERHRKEAEVVLEHMVRRLERQLPRMPFPPRSKDIHFDLDKLVERNHILESQMTPAMHSIDLLKAEIEKEEAALDRDREGLRRLEKNFAAEEREAGKQAKKVHPLLEGASYNARAADSVEMINLSISQTEWVRSDDVPAEVRSLADQFLSHLSSMDSNASQIRGLRDAIGRTDLAVERVLVSHRG